MLASRLTAVFAGGSLIPRLHLMDSGSTSSNHWFQRPLQEYFHFIFL